MYSEQGNVPKSTQKIDYNAVVLRYETINQSINHKGQDQSILVVPV